MRAVVLAARVLVAVLCGAASAGPAAAQTTHADLETAVSAFTEDLVARGSLWRQRVLVGPCDFFEQGSRRRLPLSEFLSDQFRARLHAHGVAPVEPGGNEDENRMLILQGRWLLIDERLHLTAQVGEPIVDGSGLVASASPAWVERFDERLIRLDLGFLGRNMVRQLEGEVRDDRRRTIRVGKFTIEGVDNIERVRRYLMARWLRPVFVRSRLFRGSGPGRATVYSSRTHTRLPSTGSSSSACMSRTAGGRR